MSDGNTAIPVSPVDPANEMVGTLIMMLHKAQGFSAMEAENDKLRGEIQHLADNGFSLTMRLNDLQAQLQAKSDALHLLELQNKGTEEQLSRTNTELALANDALFHKDERITSLEATARDLRRERDDIGFKHLEVSEALAEANAKLEKFRELLGVDSRPVAPTPMASPSSLDGESDGPFVEPSQGVSESPSTDTAPTSPDAQHDNPVIQEPGSSYHNVPIKEVEEIKPEPQWWDKPRQRDYD